MQEGLLDQPLEAIAGEGESKPAIGVVGLCSDQRIDTTGPCARYASLWGDISKGWHWVTHHIHKLIAAGVGAVATAVVAGVTALATTSCAASAALTADPATRSVSSALRSPSR